ncbi:MAG: LytR C-terminal domain-containing protein, partial [Acidiferrobacterales bacterium]|nr:LytR C-terminal domain-containing protein [Acidiferrobacterales bacterium]
MSKERGAWTNWLMNVALLALGLVVLVLLYGFVTRSFAPRTDPAREDNPTNLVGDILQVEVRNGCGVSGLAAEMTRFLRDQGFDVVEVGDHTVFDLEQSVVVDRVGDLEAAK